MQTTLSKSPRLLPLVAALAAGACITGAQASSHREAPFIATRPTSTCSTATKAAALPS